MVNYWNVYVIKVHGGKKQKWHAYIRASSAHKVSELLIIGIGTTADAAIKDFQRQARKRAAAARKKSIHDITCTAGCGVEEIQ